jgi:hypothetical protein
MTDKPKQLSDTAGTLLTAAAMRGDYLIPLPQPPVVAAQLRRRQVTVSKLKLRGNRASPGVNSAHPVRWKPFGRQIDDLATGRRGAVGAA